MYKCTLWSLSSILLAPQGLNPFEPKQIGDFDALYAVHTRPVLANNTMNRESGVNKTFR